MDPYDPPRRGGLIVRNPQPFAGTPPSSYTSVTNWWHAPDTASLTQSGGLVSSMANQIGGGKALASSGTPRPTTGTRTAPSGVNGLDFDGTSDSILYSGFDVSASTPITFLVVAQADVTNADMTLFGFTFQSGRPQIRLTSGGQYDYRSTNAAQAGTTSTSIFNIVCVFNGASSSMLVNGTTISSGFNIGAVGSLFGFEIGSHNQGGSPFFNGVFFSAATVQAVISAGDLANWDAWSRTVFGGSW